MMLQVDPDAVVTIGHRRTGGATFVPFRGEHEVMHDQLRTAPEEIRQRRRPVLGVEHVVLIDSHPRQRLSLDGELIAAAGELLRAGLNA